ncbi:MAG: hypothetical protein ACREVE_10805 [Gammaproteobacteria bacterium]
MNTHDKLTKSSTLALALAALFVGSTQIGAAGQSSLLWAEHLKDAHEASGQRPQTLVRTPCIEAEAEAKHAVKPIWAEHFKRAYAPSVEQTEFAAVATHQSALKVSPLRKTTLPC